MSKIENWTPIYQAYYIDKRTNSSILKEFNLPVQTTIYKCFPPYVHSKFLCEYCNKPLNSTFASKTSKLTQTELIFNLSEQAPTEIEKIVWNHKSYEHYLPRGGITFETKEGYRVSIPSCPDCEHTPTTKCQCKHCSEKQSLNLRIISEQLQLERDSTDAIPIDYDRLSCRQLFIGIYILTYCISEYNNKVDLSLVGNTAKNDALESNLFIPDPESIDNAISMNSIYEYMIDEERITYIINSNISADETIKELKHHAAKCVLNEDMSIELAALWADLALDEALTVLKHYCDVFRLSYRPGEQTISSIRKSLSKYGLAQTARYIYNSVKYAHTTCLEKNYDSRRSFNLIYGNLNFWIDDERARTWNAPAFNRGAEVLCEPQSSIAFSHSFLDIHGIDYFKDPIRINIH